MSLTTHVLDLTHGTPAAGVRVTLDGPLGQRSAVTNADGRLDHPLIAKGDAVPGAYVLSFAVAQYFRSKGVALPEPPFIDVVPIHFGISDPDAHSHVPLLVSPFGFSTYRGS